MNQAFIRIKKEYIFRVFTKCSFFKDWTVFVGLSGCLNEERYMSEHIPSEWLDICIRNTKDNYWEDIKNNWQKFLKDLDIFYLSDYLDYYQRIFFTKIQDHYVEISYNKSNEEIKLEFE